MIAELYRNKSLLDNYDNDAYYDDCCQFDVNFNYFFVTLTVIGIFIFKTVLVFL